MQNNNILVGFSKSQILKSVIISEEEFNKIILPKSSDYAGYTFLVPIKKCYVSVNNENFYYTYLDSEKKISLLLTLPPNKENNEWSHKKKYLTALELKKEMNSWQIVSDKLYNFVDLLKIAQIDFVIENNIVKVEEIEISQIDDRLQIKNGLSNYVSSNINELLNLVICSQTSITKDTELCL